jgi:hypothetical protein
MTNKYNIYIKNMVGPLDLHDPINDPLAAPPPETLDYGELDAVVSSPTEYADPDKMEYAKLASMEKKHREGIEIQRRKEADRRFEQQRSNTNESDVCASTFCSSPTKKQSYSDFCDKCYLEMIEPVNPGDGYSSSESESTDTKDESGGFLSWLF